MRSTSVPLSRFVLCAPGEGLSYWFVSHDFAGALGVEYSRDAATELKQVLHGHRVRLDYEADEVTVRITRSEDVIPALRSIYHRLGWDEAELDRVEPSVRAYKRPRPRKIAAGETFLVPVSDDLYGLGQVLEVSRRAPTVAIFAGVGEAADVTRRDPAAERPLAIFHLGLGCSLLSGEWPVTGSRPVAHSPSAGHGGKRDAVGARSYGGDGYVVELLRAHSGLDSWEQNFADPEYLRKMVLV